MGLSKQFHILLVMCFGHEERDQHRSISTFVQQHQFNGVLIAHCVMIHIVRVIMVVVVIRWCYTVRLLCDTVRLLPLSIVQGCKERPQSKLGTRAGTTTSYESGGLKIHVHITTLLYCYTTITSKMKARSSVNNTVICCVSYLSCVQLLYWAHGHPLLLFGAFNNACLCQWLLMGHRIQQCLEAFPVHCDIPCTMMCAMLQVHLSIDAHPANGHTSRTPPQGERQH